MNYEDREYAKKCTYCEYKYTSNKSGVCKECENEIKDEQKGDI